MSFARHIRAAVLLLAAAFATATSMAQSFPSRPIRILVGFAPGGATDVIARLYALHLQTALNTPVIVDNRAGASELLAIRPLLSAPPDGYTLWLAVGSSLSMGPAIRKDLPYDPLTDFSHVAMVATASGVFFANPTIPVRSMGELVSYAKANPGKLNYASAGVGSSSHLQMEYLMKAAGITMTHIPYKATNESTQAVVGGTVHVGLSPAQPVIPLALDGKLRALAVTGANRLRALPSVPTVAESNLSELRGLDGYTFYALVGPAKMPQAVVERINEAVNKVSAMPEVAARMRDAFSAEPLAMSVPAFRQYIDKEVGKWREVGKTVKIETPAN